MTMKLSNADAWEIGIPDIGSSSSGNGDPGAGMTTGRTFYGDHEN